MSGLLGYLIGVMLDPLTWGVAIAVSLLLRPRPWYIGVLAAGAAAVVVSLVFSLAVRPGDPSNLTVGLFTVVATVLWALIVAGVMAAVARKPKA